MATTPKFYKKEIADALVAETWKVCLLTSLHTINAGTQQTYADVSANECVGAGYTAGGNTLAGKAAAYVGNNVKITATNLVFTAVTVTPRYAVAYETTGNKIRQQFNLGADFPSAGGNITLTWNASGVLTVS